VWGAVEAFAAGGGVAAERNASEGMANYLPVLMFMLVALAFPLVTLALAKLVRPQRDDAVKLAPYECGVEAVGDARGRYSIRFYVIAVLFVVFDVETIFLFPWAVEYLRLGWLGLLTMGLFLAVLLLGFAYAWKKGALEWA
jgi:NADH-quinone oxidoreductase subunit A